MPVRERVEQQLSRHVMGGVFFRHGRVDPECGVNQAEVDLIFEFVAEMYCGVIDQIDWNRICIEATARCFRLQDEDKDHKKGSEFAEFCPDCLRLQLLTFEKDAEELDAEIMRPDRNRPDHLSGEVTKQFAAWLKTRKKEADDGPDRDD